MTRRSVYGGVLLLQMAAVAMTLASIAIPNWISYDTETTSGSHVHNSYGLHSACANGNCKEFPSDDWCHAYGSHDGSGDNDGPTFCSMWRTVGFLMSFAVVLHGMTLVAFAVVLLSGVQKRVKGRPVVCALLALVGIVQLAAMAIIAYLFDHDAMFFSPWRLGESWMLCTASWVVCLVSAVGVWGSTYLLPMEGDYELIPDTDGERAE